MPVMLFKIKDPIEKRVDKRKFSSESVLIGRAPECQLSLNDARVSKHHAEISCASDGSVYVMDLRSRDGVQVNGVRIEERTRITPKDVVRIGDTRLQVAARLDNDLRSRAGEDDDDDEASAPPPPPPAAVAPLPKAPEPIASETESAEAKPKKKDIWADDSEFGFLLEFLAPIKPFLLDPEISEIMVNGPAQVYIEKKGRLHLTGARFPSDTALISVVQNIAQSVGRAIDKFNPILDARLPDGSRVNAVIQPCARRGTYIAIRKFQTESLTIDRLISYNALTQHAADFIGHAVRGSLNVIVTGGTGSGKTTLLNIVSGFIPDSERIIVIEDASELQLNQVHLLPMETRQADPRTNRGRVSIRDLLRTSLRLRPDRIVIGELRGEEAFDLLQAFNTGHRGSMTTVHSNSPKDCLNRLEMLVTLAGLDVPLRAIREQIASAVDMVIYTSRLHDGSRKITHVTEVLPLNEEGNYVTNDLFKFAYEHVDEEGHIHGKLKCTGNKPKNIAEYFEAAGISFPSNYFTEGYEPQRRR